MEFDDQELENVITVADLVEVTRKRLKASGQAANEGEVFAEIVSITHNLAGTRAESIGPDTELISLGTLSLSR